MCSLSQRHLLPSHRNVPGKDIQYIRQLSDSRVLVADAVRLLEKHGGGPLYFGYGLRDVYNMLAEITKKSLREDFRIRLGPIMTLRLTLMEA